MYDRFEYDHIPSALLIGLDMFLKHGIPPGDFMRSVLENNLKNAVSFADEESGKCLLTIVTYLYNHVAAAAWGSPQLVQAWQEMAGDKRLDLYDQMRHATYVKERKIST